MNNRERLVSKWHQIFEWNSLRARVVLAFIFLLLVGFLLLSCAPTGIENGRSEVQPELPTFTGGPRIFFYEDFVDLGEATLGQEIHTEFRFWNIGDDTLVLHETTKQTLEGC